MEIWEKVGQKLKWHQESSTPIGHQNLFTWGMVRTALMPIHIPNSDTKANEAGKTPCHMRAEEATSIASDQEDLSLLLKNMEISSPPPIPPSGSRSQVPLCEWGPPWRCLGSNP